MVRKFSLISALAILTTSFTALTHPSLAAEEVVIASGNTNLVTLPIADIETYAKTGTATPKLQPILNFLSAQQRDTFKGAMTYQFRVQPAPFGQFLNSKLGGNLLEEFATVVKPPQQVAVSPTTALKTAFNQAATGDGNFTLVEVLRQYPNPQVVLDQQAVQDKLQNFQTLGSDLQLLLAAAGVNVDVSKANLDPTALKNLYNAATSYANDLQNYTKLTGLTQQELNAPTPPTGTITVKKADLYQLYQKFNRLGQQTKQFVDNSGIKVEVTNPAK